MTMEYVNEFINEKINNNEDFIRFTFFELRIKENLNETDTLSLISLAAQRLENNNYKVFRTGQKYYYNYKEEIVKENELLIAIKQKKGDIQNGRNNKLKRMQKDS
ncbi:MAG: hypothetical protein Q4G09_08045 [Clostridia bacterium]|nr:hypothetical protein [Clostridia bacterium]